MLASKVTVSNDTINQTKLNNKERGRLRFAKLVELGDSGRLAFIESREDLALACGYTKEQKQVGSQWVCYLIKRGYLKEEVDEFANGKYKKKYYLTGKRPDYEYKGVQNAHSLKKPTTIATKQPKEVGKENITITKGDLSISLSLDGDKAVELITALLK